MIGFTMTTNSQNRKKIMGLEKLVECVAQLKHEGHSVALCHGTFDLLHVGHIKHIEFAKEVADRVIFMAEGNIVEQGTPQEIFHNPQDHRLKKFLRQVGVE